MSDVFVLFRWESDAFGITGWGVLLTLAFASFWGMHRG